MAIQVFKRYEQKFVINEKQKASLLARINDYVCIDKFCQGDKLYSILNVYYDSDDNDLIRYSVSKPPFKEKLRLRSYSEELTMDSKVFLEIKRKAKGVVTKRRIRLSLKEADDFVNNGIVPKYDNYFDNQVANEISYFINAYHIKPKVFIGYRRYALFAKDNPNIRITFDQDIQGRRDEVSLQNGFYGDKILVDGTYIMEVKVDGALPLWLVKPMNELNIFPTGFSKYGKEYEKWIKEEVANE